MHVDHAHKLLLVGFGHASRAFMSLELGRPAL